MLNREIFVFQDSARNTRRDEATGYLVGEVNATCAGVFAYPGRGADGGTMLLLRHPDDVNRPESVATAYLKPITVWHPPKDVSPDGYIHVENITDLLTVGTTGERHRISGLNVVLSYTITHPEGIEAVENGLDAVSMVHNGRIVEEPGTWRNPETGVDYPYTHREYDIVYNSMAVVDRGRAGPQAKIFLDRAEPEGAHRMKTTHKIKGIPYEGDAELVNALIEAETALADRAPVTPKAYSDSVSELETTKGKLDTAEAKITSLTAKVKAFQDAEEAAGRAKTVAKAKLMGLADDAMSDADDEVGIMKKAIMAKNPKASLADKSDDRIRGMFDAYECDPEEQGALEDREESEVIRAQRAAANGGKGKTVEELLALSDKAPDNDTYVDPVEAARLRQESDANAWKAKPN